MEKYISNNTLFTESPDISQLDKRISYLISIQQYEEDGRIIFFIPYQDNGWSDDTTESSLFCVSQDPLVVYLIIIPFGRENALL